MVITFVYSPHTTGVYAEDDLLLCDTDVAAFDVVSLLRNRGRVDGVVRKNLTDAGVEFIEMTFGSFMPESLADLEGYLE